MRRFIFAAAAILAGGAFAGSTGWAAEKCEPSALAVKYPSLVGKTIRVAQDPQGGPPYSFRDPENFDTIVGLDADTVRAVFDCIGLRFEFKTGSWSGLLPAVIAGQADVMWSNLYYTPARGAGRFRNLSPGGNARHCPQGQSEECPHTRRRMRRARCRRPRHGRGRDVPRHQRKMCRSRQASARNHHLPRPTGIRMLLKDRADLMMGDSGGGAYTVKLYRNDLESGYVILTDYKVGPGISKSMPELRRAIFDAMQILQADGTEKQLMVKYDVDPELQRPVGMFTK
jgi:polar amino acid transport system substrate-binding protein